MIQEEGAAPKRAEIPARNARGAGDAVTGAAFIAPSGGEGPLAGGAALAGKASGGDGARMRLICFPHGGGGAQAFRDWAALLPPSIAPLAFAPPGRGRRRREPAFRAMAPLIAHILQEIPPWLDRPYALLGHSVGALVAFETARALERAGAPRPLRVILSGYSAPEIAEAAPPMSALDDEALWRAVAELGLAGLGEGAAAEELKALALPAIRADFETAETHRCAPGGIAAPLTLMAGEDDPVAPPESLAGWASRSAAGAESMVFPGGHFFIESAREEMLARLARRLAADLETLAPSILRGTPSEAPAERSLARLFAEQAARTPEADAVIGEGVGEGRRISFAALDRETALLARRLIALGAGRGRLVAIRMATGPDYPLAMLAPLRAGAGYLPLDPALPADALAETLAKTDPVAVLTDAPGDLLGDLLGNLPEAWRGKAIALTEGWTDRLAGQALADAALLDQAAPEDLAYGVLSSGTTGAPKAILCPHRGAAISYHWRWRHLPYGEEEREAANVFFVWEALRPLLQGRPLHPIPDAVIYDPPRLVEFLERNRITRLLVTPSLLEQVLNAEARGAVGDLRARLAALRILVLNGEVVTAALWRRVRERLPHLRLVNDYSISETHDVCHLDLSERAPAPGDACAPAGAIMDGVSVYVLDENGAPAPWGATGEVYVGGPTLALGYLDNPEESAARFLPDPFADDPRERRMFRTGDLGRLRPDGALEITGRAKFLIKLRGYSVVPGAVETALASHPAVAAAAVTPVLDPKSGQPEALAAFLSLSEGGAALGGPVPEPLRREILAHLKARLPAYAIPHRLIALDPWPLNPATGKLDRKALPPLAPPAAAPLSPSANPLPAAARDRRLERLWEETLGRAPEDDAADFFDLGGHSLLAVELALAIGETFGVRFDVVEAFDHPTLGAMRAAIDAKLAAAGRGGFSAPAISAAAAPTDKAPAASGAASGGGVAILSLAGRFPGAETPEGDLSAFWRLLEEGRSGLRRLDDDALDRLGVDPALRSRPDYVPVSGALEEIELFDPQLFGLSAREATLIDPQHRLFLESCWRALEFAGYPPRAAEAMLAAQGRAGGVGVWGGCWLPLYLLRHLGGGAALDPGDPAGFHLAEIGNDKDYLASRAAYLLNLTGPAAAVQTSCSTGLVAIAEAARALRDGRCAMALAGAASLCLPRGGYVAEPGHIGSPGGACRTFDAAADGVVFSDGVGVALLKRLEEALADGDPIVAVIRGFAVGSDGAAKAGFSAPSAKGQERTLRAALADAALSPAEIDYVEAHGTGTLIGDPIEVAALARAYGERPREDRIRLGSIKPNLGHSNIAAGFAGFAKTALALQEGALPATIGIERPNPRLELDRSPFALQTETTPWPARPGARRAAVSSLGVGGVNCHMILESAPERPAAVETQSEALLLSARSREGLAALAEAAASRLERLGGLADAAATLRAGRETGPYRLAVAARDGAAAAEKLRAARIAPGPAPERAPRLAFVFPGQGAQHPGMAAGLYVESPVFRRRFETCRVMFADLIPGLDIADMFEQGERLLARATGLQPTLFSVEIALAATLEAAGLRAEAVAGHSLGEYAAATLAGTLTLEEAARLVAARARATEAAPEGAMLSVAGPEAALTLALAQSEGLTLAARNAPAEWALAGAPEAVARLETAIAGGAFGGALTARRVRVDRAFHSPLMREAAASLAEAAAAIPARAPAIPFAAAQTGAWLETQGGEYWPRQMAEPVRFRDAVARLAESGVDAILEVGPGRTLARAVLRSLPEGEGRPAALSAMRHADSAEHDLGALHAMLGALWERGATIDWAAFRAPLQARRIALPGTPFDRRPCWRPPAAGAAPASADVDAHGKAEGAADRLSPPAERFLLPGFAQAAPAQAAAPGRWRWLAIVEDERPAPIAEAVLDGLAAAGDRIETATLSRWLERPSSPAERALWLRGLESASPIVPAAELARFGAALAERAETPVTLFLLSAGAAPIGAETLRPAAAARLGPWLSLAQETPRIGARALDLADAAARPAEIAALIRELRAERLRPEPFAALRQGRVWVERIEPFAPPPEAREAGRALLRQAGAMLVTGGLGRIGLALAERLTALGAPVLLAGRRAARPSERIAALRAGGARIEIARADLADPAETRALLEEVETRFGRLGGVFHAAGLADLKYIGETSEATIAAEAAGKVGGALNLSAALAERMAAGAEPPEFVALFSSLAAPLGGLGMSGYAAANRQLDLIAEAKAREAGPGPRWLSIGWDDWDFDYGREQVGAYARTRIGLALPPSEALDALETLLGVEGLSHALVSATPLAPRIRRWVHQAAAPVGGSSTAAAPGAAPPGDEPRDAPPAGGYLEATLTAYRRVLGEEGVDPDADFFELGGDSLLATQLASALAALRPEGPRPRIADVFDHPTPRRLAARLERGAAAATE